MAKRFKRKQKVYIIKKAEYGRILDIKRDGLIRVDGFKSGEMWLRETDIEPGD
jgi:hypothetical protein